MKKLSTFCTIGSVRNRTPFDYERAERIRAVKSYFYSPRIVLI